MFSDDLLIDYSSLVVILLSFLYLTVQNIILAPDGLLWSETVACYNFSTVHSLISEPLNMEPLLRKLTVSIFIDLFLSDEPA